MKTPLLIAALSFFLAAAAPEPASAEETGNLESEKCFIIKTRETMANIAVFFGKDSARRERLSSRALYGHERMRDHVWTAEHRIRTSDAWADSMAKCLSGEVHDSYVYWLGVSGFQGEMTSLPPHERCALWSAAPQLKESQCLGETDQNPDWENVLSEWFQGNHRSFLTGSFVTDYAAFELMQGNIVKAHRLAYQSASQIRRGGIPMSDYRNRALAILSAAARLKPDPEWEYWSLYEAAAGHVNFGGSAIYSDPWYAESFLRRCQQEIKDFCKEEDIERVRKWALERGSLIRIGGVEDCREPLAARQAALTLIWLRGGRTPSEKKLRAEAQTRIELMREACAETLAAAERGARAFAAEWAGYPSAP